MHRDVDALVDDYLERLDDALSGLPADRRDEIVEEIADHLDAARAAAGDDPLRMRDAIVRLGSPEAIAAEAGAPAYASVVTTARATWREPLAIVLLLFGGFLFAIGWFVGVALLWASPVWRPRDKVVGTLLVPGGLLTSLVGVGMAVFGSGADCNGMIGACPGPSIVLRMAWTAVGLVLVLGPLASAAWLAWRLRGRMAQPAAVPAAA